MSTQSSFARPGLALKLAIATEIGGRTVNADAACVERTPLGAGAAVVDGIGDTPAVAGAARRAADTAAVVASHRDAQAGIMAAADTMPDYPGAPNAVAAVVSVDPTGRVEVAHVGDAAVWTWSRKTGLRCWTVEQTVGEHVRHMLANPNLTIGDRVVLDRLGDAANVLSDYVLNGLVYATVATISWTPLRGEHADVDLILLTSDGIHKRLTPDQIAAVASEHIDDVQVLVDRLAAMAVYSLPARAGEVHDNATAAAITLHRTTPGTDDVGGA